MKSLASTISGIVLAFVASSVSAQQPDMNLMMKWSSAAVIHYDVLMEYAGEPEILRGPRGFTYQSQVKDRVELAFDWNTADMKVVGTPVIKNFPSTVSSATAKPGCPPVRVNGAYEHAEVTGVKGIEYNPGLDLAVKRTHPAGGIPFPADVSSKCGDVWDESAAKSETTSIGLLVVPGLYFAMPSAAGTGATIGKDGKTIIMTDKPSGWTYTYTLTIK